MGPAILTSRWHFDDPEQGQAFLQHLQETEKDPSLFRGERGPVGRPIPLSQIAAAVMAGAPEGGHKALLATYGDNPLRRAKKLIDQSCTKVLPERPVRNGRGGLSRALRGTTKGQGPTGSR